VTFESVIWVVGSGSLANVASFTPGAVGVTQATNALALKTCCGVPNSVAVDYSTAQQLITTAWNQIVAIVLVLWIFGWSGGKQLVGGAYTDAKVQVAETKEARKQKKLEKKEAKKRGEEAGAAEQSEE
jgi:beta-lactamase regulating signal transducer with metallopeptidase domain